jgi:hypothetical protein
MLGAWRKTAAVAALAGVVLGAGLGASADDALARDSEAEARGVSQAITAAELAAWGRARGDAGALIMAARLLKEVPLRPGEGAAAAFLTPDALLDQALALAPNNAGVAQAVAHVRGGTRGVRTSPFGRGPIVTVKEIQARETYGFEVEARGGEVLRVAAIGDGDTDIDLAIRDADGRVVCRDGFGDHYPVCTVARPQTGAMRIDIVNRGEVWTKVQILSN